PPAGRLRLGKETFEIPDPEATIGRDPQSEVPVADPAVSWSHAQLTRYGGHLYLRDLGSRNGTFVNAELVTIPRLLRDGDVIHIGNTGLTFGATAPAREAGAAAPAAATMPAPPVQSLTVSAGPLAGRSISLGSLPLVIGRQDAAGTFGLQDGYVSHRHLEVLRVPEGGSAGGRSRQHERHPAERPEARTRSPGAA
ncbi:MAG: FHA domain-containing protein, partial [Actinomycetota bacterium]